MSESSACTQCGRAILPATAQRTDGLCMPCYKGPALQHPGALPRLLASGISTTRLLEMLEATIIDCCRTAACHAANHLAAEKVYGFWLYHHIFAYPCCTVFTEAGLDAAVRRYQERGNTAETRESLRWSPCDSPHHGYLPFTFANADLLYLALECQDRLDGARDQVERFILRAIRQTRRNRDLPDSVVMLVCEADHDEESLLVSAEQFCSPATLETFRGQLSPLREDFLATYRARVPRY